MRILYAITTVPFPPEAGVHIRELAIGRLLRTCGRVTLLSVVGGGHAAAIEQARAAFDDVIAVEWRDREVERHGLAARLDGFGKQLWPGYFGQKLPPEQCEFFRRVAREHDLVWFHTLAITNCFNVRSMGRSVVDMDDLVYRKLELNARIAPTMGRRLWRTWGALKWRLHEMKAHRRFGIACVCSEADKLHLGGQPRIHVVPNGFTMPAAEPIWRPRTCKRLGFIGTLGYHPNNDAIRWFRDTIWPRIVREEPGVQFRIVGRLLFSKDSPPLNHPGFDLLGYLDDPADEIATWSAMVVPLRVGGGTRIKIIEAFSRKCPVVSTAIGAYGIEATNGRHLILADRPEDFADACLHLIRQPAAAPMVEEAWKLFLANYTWDAIGARVERAVEDCLKIG